MGDLRGLLDLADMAVARSEGVLSIDERKSVAAIARRARLRAGYIGEGLVVALAGGTGSGKSSLLNALVGHEVVRVGVVRPTTTSAVAAVPAEGVVLGRLIGDLGIGTIVQTSGEKQIVYVDLPDFDSIEQAHRQIVNEVLPVVDAVVWVFDPEKYSDPVIHTEFLGSLGNYSRQFIFALNQIDRIADDARSVAMDLERQLLADGIEDPMVVLTTAQGHTDVGDLTVAIEERLDAKRTALSKLAIDLTQVANRSWATSDRLVDVRAGADASSAALAAATFVSLGVEAFEFAKVIDAEGTNQ
ncbi:MAG: 50S ribosome-binding GTPase [Actinomycetia bacterium]|nr:50S ribosome-binding GTPase [Actinomycetes bacterium]